MDWFEKQKLDNVVSFFAEKHKELTNKNLSQTFLYKYLAFLDFTYLKKVGHPSLNLKYLAMERGPVPIDIYKNKNNLKSELYEFENIKDDIYIVHSKRKADLDYLDSEEIKIMRALLNKYAHDYATASEISEDSHKEIKAWIKAFNVKKNQPMKYEDELEFSENNLTFEEEAFKVWQSLHAI
ncbi:MAG TPA: DUF4065 domain-containing protein [Leptospiraceae bacterium]|nr:DUF4065 domain-containing protein [Leptospiraceae bacterium]HMZ67033.1 DUF4065 domain-containing protein [Leptospiraceae bacterium]HNA10248.1 DUF4065 domain-containing protein [Leptospiraceae bacterium]HNC59560.1 DUF4065 domain-containing protein [Leptospiraceae bacterium]HNE11406.1 DUF4065 domain-containing protein [Leptospiraceae bacterium]